MSDKGLPEYVDLQFSLQFLRSVLKVTSTADTSHRAQGITPSRMCATYLDGIGPEESRPHVRHSNHNHFTRKGMPDKGHDVTHSGHDMPTVGDSASLHLEGVAHRDGSTLDRGAARLGV